MSSGHVEPTKSAVGVNWDPAYEFKLVALVTIGFGLVALDRWIIAPLFPFMAKDINADLSDLGDLVGAVGLMWGVFSLIAGGLSDKFGRRIILVPATIGFSLMAGVSGMATGLTALIAVRMIMGITEGAFTPTSFATLAEASKPTRLGFNNGLQQSAFPLVGLGLGPIIATQLMAVVPSWRWVFLVVAIPGLIVAILLWFVIREPKKAAAASPAATAESAPKVTLKQIFAHRNVVIGMIALFGNMAGVFVLSGMTPVYLTDFVKVEPQQMGFIASAIGFGGFLGQLTLPGLSDVLGRKTVLLASFVGSAVCAYAFGAVGAASPGVLFALLFATCFFCFANLGIITGPIAVESAPPMAIATTAGIIIGAGEIFGGGVAPAIAGRIAQANGLPAIFTVAIAGFIIGLVATLFLKETAPRKVGSGVGAG